MVSPSPLAVGCVKFGSMAATCGTRAIVRLIHEAIEQGVTTFDTADAYGNGTSEIIVGRALADRRPRAFVATKAGYLFEARSASERLLRNLARPVLRRARRRSVAPGTTRAGGAYADQDFSQGYLLDALDASLRRLRTDYVDLFQLHGPGGPPPPEFAGFVERVRTSGKALHVGVGLERLEHAHSWLSTPGIGHIQLPFGVLVPAAGDEILPAAARAGVYLTARGVFGSGLVAGDPNPTSLSDPHDATVIAALTKLARRHGVEIAQLALWFVRLRPEIGTVLVGMTSREHLGSTIAMMDTALPSQDLISELHQAVAARPDTPAAES